MKKVTVKTMLSAALAAGILATSAFAAPVDTVPLDAAATEADSQALGYTVSSYSSAPIRVWGSITEKGEDRFTVKNSSEAETYNEVVVNVTDETMILDAVTGESKTFADLKADETVYAYVGPAMTRSLPPIANGVLVLCNIPADYAVPTYAEVQSVTSNDEGRVSALTDVDVILHLTDETEITAYNTKNTVTPADIKPGDHVLSWYSFVALSLPAQASPTKVIVFPYSYESYVTLNESGITLDGDMVIGGIVSNEKLLLPVRTVAEALGYTVEWVNESRSVVVTKGEHTYTFAIGGETVTVGENDMALTAAPQLIDGVTYLTLDDLILLHSLKLAQ